VVVERTRVLLVEDNPGDARLVREALNDGLPGQFTVQVAESLKQALETLRAAIDEVDVVLLDLSLPDSQGLETYRAVHAQCSACPILVLSGLNDESIALKAVNEGAQDFLRKSRVDSELLPRAIHYAIERNRLLEQVRQLAIIDELTGLMNRRGFMMLADHQRNLADRKGTSLTLLYLDVDRFKLINDHFGHEEGDRALRELAAVLLHTFRRSDVVARLGGDEFVVLLEADVRPDTPGIIGERIRAAFDVPFDWHGTEVRCGASVGVSLYPDHARDPAALLASADEAMYREKSNG
jgi:two-component system, cell cycle response regulator